MSVVARCIPSAGLIMRTALLIGLVVAAGSGCAALAKKPTTPAAEIDGEALARTAPPPNERYYLLVFSYQPRS
jgi:hypothetical protein